MLQVATLYLFPLAPALLLVYSCGLRPGELVKLRPADVQIGQKQLFLHAGEGRRGSYTLLSDPAIRQLWAYQYLYQRVAWLFEGQTGGQYSSPQRSEIFSPGRCQPVPYRPRLTT